MSKQKLSAEVQRTLSACLPTARYRSTWEFRLKESDQEIPRGLSMSVPNEHLDLKDMAEKYRRTGVAQDPRGSMRRGEYGDDDLDGDDLEKISRMDIADQVEHLEYRRALGAQEKAENDARAAKAAEARKTTEEPAKQS